MERYREVRQRPWQESARYLAAALGLLAVAVFVAFSAYAAPVPGRFTEHVRAVMPDGVTLTVTNGKLSVAGHEGPLALGTADLPFVIDPSLEGAESVGEGAPAEGFVVGRDAIFLREEGKTTSVQDLRTFPDTVITKEQILASMDRYGFLFVAIAALTFTSLHLVFLFVNIAIFVLFASWVSAAVGMFWRVQLSYRQWVAVGLHAVTLPILADHLFWSVSARIPFAFPILFFMIVIAVLVDERQSPTGKPTEATA